MTASIQESIEVDVPVREAYNQWTQLESFPQFMSGIKEIKQLDDTHNHWIAAVGGVTREFDTVITEQEPDTRLAWKATDGKTHAGVVDFHRLSDSKTQISVQMDWEPEGFVEQVGSALNFDEREIKRDLAKFKELIEANGFAEGAWRGEVTPD